MSHEQIIDDLLKEFIDHRAALRSMIKDLEQFRKKIDTIMPETLEKRYKFYFEEKVKSVMLLFTTLLSLRQEIAKTVKDEIEIRRKNAKDLDKGNSGLEEFLDIRKIANKVEKFQQKQKEFKTGIKDVKMEG